MTEPNISHIVRRYFQAYEAKVRNDIEALLGNDFVFSSPHDDRIDRQTYLAQCWPFAKDVAAFHIEKLFLPGGEGGYGKSRNGPQPSHPCAKQSTTRQFPE